MKRITWYGAVGLGLAGFFQCLEIPALDFPMFGKNDAPFFQSLENSFAAIPGGAFIMGSREGNVDARPREVAVPPFQMAVYEVTAAEFAAFLNDTASAITNHPQLVFDGGRWTPRRGEAQKPAAYVSYGEAAAYCAWLGKRLGKTARLPSEEEWEFAARGGIERARYPWGWGDPARRACFDAEAPEPVGSFEPNAYGLYDMAGNVFEWCGPPGSNSAAARGGSWSERDARFLCVYHRTEFPIDYRDADVGFRIVISY